jgi:hypothetical protein
MLCYCRAESDKVKKNVPTSEVDCGMFAVETSGVRALLLAKVQYLTLFTVYFHTVCKYTAVSITV